jgi:hypothetical protein
MQSVKRFRLHWLRTGKFHSTWQFKHRKAFPAILSDLSTLQRGQVVSVPKTSPFPRKRVAVSLCFFGLRQWRIAFA